MEKNFEPTIEMPDKLIAHLEGEKELTHEELIGGPIENENKIENEVKLETFNDIVESIKNEYGIENIPEFFKTSAETRLDNMLRNKEFTKEQAFEKTKNSLLIALKLKNNNEQMLTEAKKSFQLADSAFRKYESNQISFEEVTKTLELAKNKLTEAGEKGAGMLHTVDSWIAKL